MDQQEQESTPMVWDANTNEYDCDCPGPPPPPEFLLPPPPAPPSAAYCQDNAVSADLEYCDLRVVEGSYTQTAIPSIAVIVLCSVLMLVMLLVATVLLWKHKKKMQNFLPCKTSPQNHCDLSGANSVLYEDLTNIRPRNLANHCVPDQTIAPIEVGAPSQLKLLDVKCSNYGGAGFTPMGNTMFIYPPKETDTLKSAKSREHFNPAYEEVSAGSEKVGPESQDSELESDEPPSVASEDEFAEDELSLVDFPKVGSVGNNNNNVNSNNYPGEEADCAGPGSGTSSLRGSTGDDLCKDLDSIGGSEGEHDGGRHHHHNHHHHHHHHHHPHSNHPHSQPRGRDGPPQYADDARVRTVERNRQHNYAGDHKVYDKDVLPDYRPHPQEAELIEQLRQGAASGVALGPHEFVVAYPLGMGVGGGAGYPPHGRGLYASGDVSGGHYRDNYCGPGVIYTPGVYGAGELGPKDAGQAPPVYSGRRNSPHPPPPPLPPELGGPRILNPARLPVPLISELSQKLNNGVAYNGGLNSSGGGSSNRNSRSSSSSGGDHGPPTARNSDPHERTLTEFSTFRPKKARDAYPMDSGFASAATTLPASRRGGNSPHPQGATPTQQPPEAQKLLDELAASAVDGRNPVPTPRSRRAKNPENKKFSDAVVDPSSNVRTVIT